MFVPDLLHEFELGVWKAIFTHLMRILFAAGDGCIRKLNWRYRNIPTFGRGTIRRFHENASAMKKLAGRDFEDLLQCSLPVFEGLLPPPHNDIVLDLLFLLCEWHAFAKLRLHTDTTLKAFGTTTQALGHQIRLWVKKTCSAFDTRELPKEEGARHRRNAAATNRGTSSRGRRAPNRGVRARGTRARGQRPVNSRETPDVHQSKLRKMFSMCTYKLHSLGHYLAAIARFGTTDSYSTQVGELEHRRVKRFYARTNKRKTFTLQISKQQRRERILKKIRDRLHKKKTDTTSFWSPAVAQPDAEANKIQSPSPAASFEDSDVLPKTSPDQHYHISDSTRQKENIFRWVDYHEQGKDEAVTDFIPNLKDHILARLDGHAYNGDEVLYTDIDRDSIQFHRNLIYRHKTLRINYTTYDLRRQQDSINPRTHPDIMLLSHEEPSDDSDPHPYWYARVVGIFHVDVVRSGSSEKKRMNFLWVRWFGRDTTYKAGWKAHRLHRVGFLDAKDTGAFGFLDPSVVIRAVHLIPGFAHGQTQDLLSPRDSVARLPLNVNFDWQFYYLNMFVDRDMVMRFIGGGVGHKSTNKYTAPIREHVPTTNSDDIVITDPIIDEDEDHFAEEEDYGYNVEPEDAEALGEGEASDDDMGPEDGEEPWETGDLQAEGYDEL